jgi:hypothetical protein
MTVRGQERARPPIPSTPRRQTINPCNKVPLKPRATVVFGSMGCPFFGTRHGPEIRPIPLKRCFCRAPPARSTRRSQDGLRRRVTIQQHSPVALPILQKSYGGSVSRPKSQLKTRLFEVSNCVVNPTSPAMHYKLHQRHFMGSFPAFTTQCSSSSNNLSPPFR